MSTTDRGAGGRKARAATALLVLAAAAVLAVWNSRSGSDGAANTAVSFDRSTGELSFRLDSFAGPVVDSQDFAGTPLVLNAYASWCPTCVRELPDFERVHRALGSEVTFVGFNPQTNDTDDAQARMIRDTGVTYLTVRDPADRLLREFSPAGGLPVTLFVNGHGVVRKVHRGLLTEQLLLDELRTVLGVEG